jgi:hypothetical protein
VGVWGIVWVLSGPENEKNKTSNSSDNILKINVSMGLNKLT